MKQVGVFLFFIFFAFPIYSTEAEENLCSGFVPENQLEIPDFPWNNEGISEEEFNRALDLVQSVYTQEFSTKGREFVIERLWKSKKVNAQAVKKRKKSIIKMHGGLARYPNMTFTSFILVACHEIGHHIGGAPQSGWASNEGQSDYFATLKCFRKLAKSVGIKTFPNPDKIDPIAEDRCLDNHSSSWDLEVCHKSSMAGENLGIILNNMAKKKNAVSLSTPSWRMVWETKHNHPKPQCRLDTYFQGALCRVKYSIKTDDIDPNIGTCNKYDDHKQGRRPRCWYKPSQLKSF